MLRKTRLYISRYAYYLRSIFTILLGMSPRTKIIASFLGLESAVFTIEVRGDLRFKVRSRMDIWITKETCLDRDYEKYGAALQPGWTIVDIGGGIGDFAVLAAQTDGSSIQVYEPFAGSRRLLCENLKLNGVDSVICYPEAVGADFGSGCMDTSAPHPVMYHIFGDSVRAAEAVSTIPLSEVIRRSGKDVIDFMKVDCEGAEYDIFFNADDASLASINRICMEYHNHLTEYRHDDLCKLLRAKGFTVTTAGNPAHDTIGFLYAQNKRINSR